MGENACPEQNASPGPSPFLEWSREYMEEDKRQKEETTQFFKDLVS